MSFRSLVVVIAMAVGLTVLFWGPLWQGHGLIGGDLYTYFFPQKVFYASQLAQGNIPLWNDLVGFGYPFLAESQTGVFYPPNPILYRLYDVNTAYNMSQLGHYVLAFVFTWLLLRRLDLSPATATLGAVVFVYGWFPPRICLEWAIIGGVYFPLSLWCVESFLQTRHRGWLVLLAMSQGIHLLAGHFNLAFITQLTCVAYACMRWVAGAGATNGSEAPENADAGASLRSSPGHPLGGQGEGGKCNLLVSLSPCLLVTLALAVGFALAAIQILPTWELKQLSQRDGIGGAHDPGYGHIPPWYLSQIVAPWLWYPLEVDPDQALASIRALTIDSATNKVEAHLYFGMVPLLLIGYRLFASLRGEALDRRYRIWLWLGLAAMLYATGWLLPITRHLPGFSFFMGPGRYGIVTTFAAALLAGAGLDRLLRRRRFRSLLIGIVLGLTIADLYWVSRRVTYAVMVPDPPINAYQESEIRQLLTKFEAAHPDRPVRLLAGGPNWATLTGFAAYPQYLGIGPAVYFDPKLTMPEPTEEMSPDEHAAALVAQQEWLRQGAFTHILSQHPLDSFDWPHSRLVWQGFDQMLSRAYALQEPLSLYELTDTLPRIRLEGAGTVAREPSRVGLPAVIVESPSGGELVWADLAYPGWRAHIARESGSVMVETDEGLFRSVSLPPGPSVVVWEYAPGSYETGRKISLLTLVLLWTICVPRLILRRRRSADGQSRTSSPASPA